jgi:hypothetical protein
VYHRVRNARSPHVGAACQANDRGVLTILMSVPREIVDCSAAHAAMVLTVEEAARALRISRSFAYELARRYLTSNGVEGLPVVCLGGSALRVPRWALQHLLETGELPRLAQDAARVRRAG